MPRLIARAATIEASGNLPKTIEEFVGRVSSGHAAVSVARVRSPGGWREPGQRPEFQAFLIVVRGLLRVEHEGGALDVRPGETVVSEPGEWVRYSTPESGGAEYYSVCQPAFAPDRLHRDRASER